MVNAYQDFPGKVPFVPEDEKKSRLNGRGCIFSRSSMV